MVSKRECLQKERAVGEPCKCLVYNRVVEIDMIGSSNTCGFEIYQI